MDYWMKVIITYQSKMCTSQGDDAGSFILWRSHEQYKDDYLEKPSKFLK